MTINQEIAQEKIDFNILDKTLQKSVHLYHGTDRPGLKVIAPTSMNMGNMLSPKKRRSSFWTRNFDYAAIWSLDFIAIFIDLPYYHVIENSYFVIPNWSRKDSGENSYDYFMKTLEKRPTYVYEAEVLSKYVSRGQLPIDEYTVDINVVPDKVTTITPAMASKYVRVANDELFETLQKNSSGIYRKNNLSVPERLIFRDPKTTMRKRSNAIRKEQRKKERLMEKEIKKNGPNSEMIEQGIYAMESYKI